MQTDDDNHKTFQPHADVNDNGNAPEKRKVQAETFPPQKLGNYNVAQDKHPVSGPVGTLKAAEKHAYLILIAVVPP